MSAAPTPHASVAGAASSSATGAAAPAPPPAPATPGLPPPSTFDFIPDLFKILNRLIPAATQPSASGPNQASAEESLEIQQVAGATTEVKLKLQRARTAVLALPDIDRTCEDQQDEIEYREARIEKLKAALQQLGQPVRGAEDADQSMTG
jgi:hypothetical protein